MVLMMFLPREEKRRYPQKTLTNKMLLGILRRRAREKNQSEPEKGLEDSQQQQVETRTTPQEQGSGAASTLARLCRHFVPTMLPIGRKHCNDSTYVSGRRLSVI